jgi:hypothetical protein
MNSISASLKCVNCRKLMVSPVFLPCGCSICHRHTIDVNGGHVICCACEIEHPMPTNGHQFPLNKDLDKKIKTQFARNQNPNYIEAMKMCERFDEILTNIELILNDPFNFAYETINNLENFVQLKGEEMISNIDEKIITLKDELLDKNDEVNDDLVAKSEIIRVDGEKENLKIEKKMNLAFEKLNEYKKDCKKIFKKIEFVYKLREIEVKKVEARKDLTKWLVKINKFKVYLIQWLVDWQKVKMEIKNAIEISEIELTRLKSIVLLVDNDRDRFTRLQMELWKHIGPFQIDPQFRFGY